MKFNQSRWRAKAAEVISEVLDQCTGWETQGSAGHKAMRERLREAYPFGEKKCHPYKIWLDEIARQTGRKWPIGHKRAWENNQQRIKTERQKLAEWEALYGKRSEATGLGEPNASRAR